MTEGDNNPEITETMTPQASALMQEVESFAGLHAVLLENLEAKDQIIQGQTSLMTSLEKEIEGLEKRLDHVMEHAFNDVDSTQDALIQAFNQINELMEENENLREENETLKMQIVEIESNLANK